jgi:3-dehydroquinate synthetase
MKSKLKLAYDYLEEAQAELKNYEATLKELHLWQACEKGWAAVTQALREVNPEIKKHADFGKTAAKLAEDYKNEEIAHGEACGEMLHSKGFYETSLDFLSIKHGLICIENFLKLIDNIIKDRKKIEKD